MKPLRPVIVLSFCLLTIAGCSGGFTPKAVSRGDQLVKPTGDDLTAAERADAFADEGEGLLDPKSLEAANAKFAAALKLNPDNGRAVFWNAMLNTALKFKGILTRIRPLYGNDPARYAKATAQWSTDRNVSLLPFLKAGPQDIAGGAELQDWLDDLDSSLTDLRAALRKIRDTEITIQLPPALSLNVQASRCSETHFGPILYKDPSCDPNSLNSVALNRGDFDVLIAGTGSYQIMLEMWTAYRINAKALLGVFKPATNQTDAQAVLNSLWDIQDAGKPRKPFSQMRAIVSELIEGLRSTMENQNELCPKGVTDFNSRRGYLVSFGICVDVNSTDSSAQRNLAVLEALLAGQPVDIIVNHKVAAQVLPLKLADQPLTSAKDLGPFDFDACGNLLSFNSSALSPYFASGRFDDLRELNPPTCPATARTP